MPISPLSRSKSCINLNKETSETADLRGRFNGTVVQVLSEAPAPSNPGILTELREKYDHPKLAAVYALNAYAKLHNCSSSEEALQKQKNENPESAFRTWCDLNGKDVPEQLESDPERSYVLLCEYNGATPDSEKLKEMHAESERLKEAAKPKNAKEAIAMAEKLITNTRTVRAQATEQLAALKASMAKYTVARSA